MKILLGITGSVAATLYFKLQSELSKIGELKVVATEKGMYFINLQWNKMYIDSSYKIQPYPLYSESRQALNRIILDEKEWKWEKKGDAVEHIDLKDWADIFVIAPLTANTLAKMANGLCDNLLTSVYRAWPMNKPIVIAPAMNSDMWEHPITKEQIDSLVKRHGRPSPIRYPSWTAMSLVNPVSKELACGTNGIGAMAPIEDIVKAVERFKAV